MRAVVIDQYGPPDVQRMDEVERPLPKDDEVLIKIHATTVTRSDTGIRAAKPVLIRLFFGLRRPKQRILGTELAGEIEAIGAAVTKFAVGDHVFGSTNAFRTGAHAEYIALRESAPIAHMPAGMTFNEAAAVTDGAVLALMCLEAGGRPQGAENAHLRGIWSHRHRGGAARQILRSRRHRGVQHQERRAREVLGSRSESSTTRRRISPRAARPTTSSSTR